MGGVNAWGSNERTLNLLTLSKRQCTASKRRVGTAERCRSSWVRTPNSVAYLDESRGFIRNVLFPLWVDNGVLIWLCKSESVSAAMFVYNGSTKWYPVLFHFSHLCSRLQNDLEKKGCLSCPIVFVSTRVSRVHRTRCMDATFWLLILGQTLQNSVSRLFVRHSLLSTWCRMQVGKGSNHWDPDFSCVSEWLDTVTLGAPLYT